MLGRQFSITGKEDVIMNANSRETDDSFFKLVSVSEICKISLGGTPKTDIKDFWGGPVKWATAKDIVNNQGRYITSTERTISLSGVDNSNAKIFPKGTIVVTSRGTVGAISILGIPMSFNQTCYGLSTDDKVNSLFLYYALRNSIEKMLSLSYGTVFQTITIKTFQELKIPLPTIEEQQAIAKILSDLDEKIELNNQMNNTLEDIAQAIFKRWFIDFEFPNENGDPYKSSGGEMVESELGMIPKGWEIVSLSNIADFLNGLPLQNYRPREDEECLPVIKIRELRNGFTDSTERCTSNIPKSYIAENGDVIFSWSGSLEVVIWSYGKGAINQHLFKVSSEKYPKWFYYFWLLRFLPEFRKIAEDKATTMGHIQRHHLNESLLPVPPQELMDKFGKPIESEFEEAITLRIQSMTLSNLRDILLPKLMTGRIRVPLED
jgi:type I restriction enzyme S subunit